VLIVAAIWLAAALAIGRLGWLQFATPPLPQLLIAALTLMVLGLFWLPTPFGAWVIAVDVRVLILIHATRIIPGVAFLILHARGQLPWAFAVPGGWGDILVGVTALAVAAIPRPYKGWRRRAVLWWNAFGLADILLVVSTATRIGMSDPESLRPLLQLPLSLLPTFLVPIVIATHAALFARFRGPRADHRP